MKNYLLLFLIFFSHLSYAGLFKIINRSGGSDLLFDTLETEINKSLPNADQSSYLKGMANSAVMSGKGIGLDYATDISLVNVGYSMGLGADLGGEGVFDIIDGSVKGNNFRGIGISPSLVIGVNLGILPIKKIGFLDLTRVNLYTNFMSATAPSINGLQGEVSSFGFHLQYKLIPSVELALVRWTGVDLNFGYEYAKLKLSFQQSLSQNVDLGGGATASVSGTAQFGADVQTHSIPIEVSTGVRLLYAMTLYGGLGVDLNFGSSKSIASVSAPITTTVPAGTATGVLDLGSDSSPDSFNMRNFIGAQFNITVARFFIQLNNSFTNDSLGILLGGKIAY